MIIDASGHTVRAALTAARKLVGLGRNESIEILRSGEDGLYRCHLSSGHIVQVTVTRGEAATAAVVPTN